MPSSTSKIITPQASEFHLMLRTDARHASTTHTSTRHIRPLISILCRCHKHTVILTVVPLILLGMGGEGRGVPLIRVPLILLDTGQVIVHSRFLAVDGHEK
jgi:hypothetical protein